MIASAIRQMAASRSSNIVVAGEFEKRVHIFDIDTGALTCRFDAGLDFGGRRLAVSDDGKLCATGAYHRHGVSLHDTANGTLLWQRKDLKRIQGLRFSIKDKNSIFAFFDERSCHLLNVDDGKTAGKIRGMKWTVESPFDEVQYVDEDGHFHLLDCSTRKKIGRKEVYIPQDAAFAPRRLLAKECDSPKDPWIYDPKQPQHIVCYSVGDFSEQWRLEKNDPRILPPMGDVVRDGLFEELGFCSSTNEVICVFWDCEPLATRAKDLLYIDLDVGNVRRKIRLNNLPSCSTFANRDRFLVTSEGQVVDVETGKTLRKLQVPLRDYPDPEERDETRTEASDEKAAERLKELLTPVKTIVNPKPPVLTKEERRALRRQIKKDLRGQDEEDDSWKYSSTRDIDE